MHLTEVVKKDGTTFSAFILKWCPEEDYIKFFDGTKVAFSDCKSIITEKVWKTISKNEDSDEIERAREHLADARKYNWKYQDENGIWQDPPKGKWSWE